MSENILPLSGVTVIDFSTVVAAPTAARVLASYGADVIKVESLDGDVMRRFGTTYQVPADDETNPLFTLTNSNKRFISINLKTDEGKEILARLLSKADVFLSNIRSKSLKRLGLAYEDIKDLYPSLIYAHFSGFGQFGLDKDRPGYDTCAFWLRCGAMLDWQVPNSFPIRPVYGFGDIATSSQIVIGIVTALLGRNKTGRGTKITTSLLANGLWLNSFGVISAQPQFGRPFMADQDSPFDAFSDYYECKDGLWLGFFCNEYSRDRQKLSDTFGIPELISDPDCVSIPKMRESGMLKIISQKLRAIFKTKERDEWCQILTDVDIAFEKLIHYDEVYKDEQAWSNNYLEEISFPGGDKVAMPTVPVSFSDYLVRPTKPTGTVGQDSDVILKELGYNADEIATMRNASVIK